MGTIAAALAQAPERLARFNAKPKFSRRLNHPKQAREGSRTRAVSRPNSCDLASAVRQLTQWRL